MPHSHFAFTLVFSFHQRLLVCAWFLLGSLFQSENEKENKWNRATNNRERRKKSAEHKQTIAWMLWIEHFKWLELGRMLKMFWRACSCTYFHRLTLFFFGFVLTFVYVFARALLFCTSSHRIQYLDVCNGSFVDLMMTWALSSNYFRMIFKLRNISPSNLLINYNVFETQHTHEKKK